jgi:DNA-binding PucR family transcriptional regulator
VAHEVARRGLRPADGLTVMAVDAPGLQPSAASTRLVDALGSTPALVGQYAGDLLVLAQGDDPERLAGVLRAAVDNGTNVGTAAYATDVGSLEAIPAAYETARRCLGLHLALGRAGTVTSDGELGPYAQLFSGHDREALQAYVDRFVGPLVAHDLARSSALADTLLTYLDHGRDARTAAGALHLHANTLRQRLRTVTRLLPRWDDPRFSLETHMALRLRALLEDTTAS